ncbi:MAG: NERD domain-containing protein [Clostridia bacterium]|nr:NERD domain-containing protein [Clostridia bacterium]
MPARTLRQNREIKKLFRAKIRAKIEREKQEMRTRIDEEVPSWIRWALKPLAELSFDAARAKDASRGEGGEDAAAVRLWLFLSRDWVLVNDVVLEPEPDEFAQIDHVLVGPPGIYLVETKAWEGALMGNRDRWKRKQGSSWVPCESPTRQNLRHKRLFLKWLAGTRLDLPGHPEEYVTPVVLFTRARWLKTKECSMPVFDSGAALAFWLRRQGRDRVLSPEQVEAVAAAVAEARPWEVGRTGVEVTRGRNRQGREYVKVRGTREEAEAIRREYAERGYVVSTLVADRFEAGGWFFYLDG